MSAKITCLALLQFESNIIQIWTDPEGNIRLYGSRESNIAQGRRPRAILHSRGPYNLICSRDQSIFVLLYDH